MRNIDNDRDLCEFARKYHTEELSRDQYDWVLEERGYDREERDCALVDYYWVYIDESRRLTYLLFLCVFLVLSFIVIHFV